jgi:hypothetical protein
MDSHTLEGTKGFSSHSHRPLALCKYTVENCQNYVGDGCCLPDWLVQKAGYVGRSARNVYANSFKLAFESACSARSNSRTRYRMHRCVWLGSKVCNPCPSWIPLRKACKNPNGTLCLTAKWCIVGMHMASLAVDRFCSLADTGWLLACLVVSLQTDTKSFRNKCIDFVLEVHFLDVGYTAHGPPQLFLC